MKKKMMAALLSLLMICTMASGIFAGGIYTGGAIVTDPNGTVQVLSNNFMYDECPKCDYSSALHYVLDGDLKYYCPSCKAAGIVVEGSHGAVCRCGYNCDCTVTCSCGKTATCGTNCKCGRYLTCSTRCTTCWDKVYYDCGSSCTHDVKCACGKTGECGDVCRNCHRTLKCGTECNKCYYGYYLCNQNCGHSVKCACGKYTGVCGEYCKKCGVFLTCEKYCDDCYGGSWNDSWNWGWNNYCDCYGTCTCRIKCTNCYKYTGNCGEYCENCGYPFLCPDNCSTCVDTRTEYKIVVSQNVGGEYAITGGHFGYSGEKKTLTIDPDQGYAISDVVINGVSYGSQYSTFELTMNRNYYVKVTFVKLNLNVQYQITAKAVGNGRITVVKNGETVKNTASVKAGYNDVLDYRFLPGGDNYYLEDIKVNGRSIGTKSIYNISKLTGNMSIEATFAWKCPYTDVSEEHMAAVEYVTEAGIMKSINSYINTDLFKGTTRVSVKTFAAALAEMADTGNNLDNVDDRIDWAITNGLVSKTQNLSTIVNVKTACNIMAAYLEVLEDMNDVTFVGDKASNTAQETCVALKLVSTAAYNKNASISRYDLAELCYAIANLEYEAN